MKPPRLFVAVLPHISFERRDIKQNKKRKEKIRHSASSVYIIACFSSTVKRQRGVNRFYINKNRLFSKNEKFFEKSMKSDWKIRL